MWKNVVPLVKNVVPLVKTVVPLSWKNVVPLVRGCVHSLSLFLSLVFSLPQVINDDIREKSIFWKMMMVRFV